MDSARFEKVGSGLFVVRYGTEDELLPDRQKRLLDAIRAERTPSAIVFVLAEDVWKVDLSVPQFWAHAVSDPTLSLRAIAVVSSSVAVRAATHTFLVATMLRKQQLAVVSLQDEGAAVQWARKALSTPAATASP